MKISFLGGAKEVGRSAVLVDTDSENIIMDYGLKVDEGPPLFPKLPNARLNAVLWTHAHLDHLGATPLLFHKGQNCPVYGIEVTSPLARILFRDSLKIAKQEGYHLGFDSRDAKTALKHFRPIEFRKTFSVGKTKVTGYDAGHISGSTMFKLENKKSVFYSGDFKVDDTRLMKGADMGLDKVDALVIESTYSDREHPPREREERRFIDFIKGTLANDGVALVASFAISRTQEMLLVLDEYEIDYPVYIDGMGAEVTDVINSYPELQREYGILKKVMQRMDVKFIRKAPKRKKVIKNPCVIITGAGMLSGGPMVYYMKKLHDREDCSLALTGFQVPKTPGAILLQTGKFVHESLNLPVKMGVEKFGFSSHASRSELFKLIKKVNPERVFCIHGDKTEAFADELKEEHGFDAVSPDNKRVYDI